ncbi:MAG: D-2-hydroxyacid dehydrogenase [Myxococcota bacterium]
MSTGRIARIHIFHGISRELSEALARPLRARLPDREVVIWTHEDELRAGIGEIEALLAFRPPRGVWAGATRLRLFQMMGAGVDALLPAPDLPEAVRIANARGIHGPHMSEFALGMVLALAKRVPRALEQSRDRLWKPYGVDTIAGRTLAILGLGSIGAAVAELASRLGMRVIGTQREPKDTKHVAEVVRPERTEQVLRAADYLVVLVPLTPETRGSLGARELAWLKPGAYLINLARGGIVDEDALAEALRAGRLAGAALDVFAEEPLSASSPLWSAPNTILTPHVAGLGPGYMERLTEIFAENLDRIENDLPLRNEVDRARGY